MFVRDTSCITRLAKLEEKNLFIYKAEEFSMKKMIFVRKKYSNGFHAVGLYVYTEDV